MKNIRLLEEVFNKLDVDEMSDFQYYYEEHHTNINNVVKKFKEENPKLVKEYMEINSFDEDIFCDDELCIYCIVEILQGKINEIKEAVKLDLDKEYKNFFSKEYDIDLNMKR